MIKTTVTIINKLGLHARAASKLVTTATEFSSSIRIGNDQQIADAKSAGNYPLAIRFYFLLYLEQLEKQNIVNYHRDKTNQDYILEMKNDDHIAQFLKLSQKIQTLQVSRLRFLLYESTHLHHLYVSSVGFLSN